MTNFTKEEDLIIIESFGSRNAAVIGKELGRTKAEILRRIAQLKKMGEITPRDDGWADWQNDIAERMFDAGCSVREIADATGKTEKQVYNKRAAFLGKIRNKSAEKDGEALRAKIRAAREVQDNILTLRLKREMAEESKTIKVYCGCVHKADFDSSQSAKAWIREQLESFPERTEKAYRMYRGGTRVGN